MISISEEDDLRMIEEHNQKSVEELVENFAYVYVDKDIEVDIVDIELIEFAD